MESAHSKRLMMRAIVAFFLLAAVLVQAHDEYWRKVYKYKIAGIRINQGSNRKDALNEVKAFLDWVVERNPNKISGYQDVKLKCVHVKPGVFKATFVLPSYVNRNFWVRELEAYKDTDPFVAIDGNKLLIARRVRQIVVYGDPHVTFESGNRTFCFETEEPLNEILEVYAATDLGIKLNMDFRSDKPNSAKDEMWIRHVEILSADLKVMVNKNNIIVVNKIDDKEQLLKWDSNDSFVGNNYNYVTVDGQDMFYSKYANENADVADIEIDVFRTTSGSIDVTFMNADGVVTDGFIPSVISQIGQVNDDPNEKDVLDLMPVWDENKIIKAHRHVRNEDECWKITHGAHNLFQNEEDWKKFVRI